MWHSHARFAKTYKTVQTLEIYEQKQRHMRKFHFIVSKAPFSQSNQWFKTWGKLFQIEETEAPNTEEMPQEITKIMSETAELYLSVL